MKNNFIEKLIQEVKKQKKILVAGNYRPIIQSILDFDFINNNPPSISGILGKKTGYEKYFWGDKEILIPVYSDFNQIPEKQSFFAFLNLLSSRRILEYTLKAIKELPNLEIISIFAEGVPERDALFLKTIINKQNKIAIGPASIGLIIPKFLKLGAIAGVSPDQLFKSQVFKRGHFAVFSASGGMTNEIINMVIKSGGAISLSLSFGGDRFPILSPPEAFLLAQEDPQTKVIVYYGELGGYDEYAIAELINKKKITKPTIVYIAGTVAEGFKKPIQFGHAKAKAQNKKESAKEKRKVLKKEGAIVAENYKDFLNKIKTYAEKLSK